eukprot:10490539-Alexandrium_andersonii.AAC.1
MARAVGLGRSSEVIIAGDGNEEPETASASHWAAVSGRGTLVPGCPTRWNSCWADDEAASCQKMVVFEWGQGNVGRREPSAGWLWPKAIEAPGGAEEEARGE